MPSPVEGERAYFATNVGVLVVDLTRREIADTWPLAAGGESTVAAQFVLAHEDHVARWHQPAGILDRTAIRNPFSVQCGQLGNLWRRFPSSARSSN